MSNANSKVSNAVAEGMIGNGEELVELCAGKGMVIWNTCFKKRVYISIH